MGHIAKVKLVLFLFDLLSEYEVHSTTKGPRGEETSVVTTNQTHTAVENLKPESEYVSTGPVFLFLTAYINIRIHERTLSAVILNKSIQPNISNHV